MPSAQCTEVVEVLRQRQTWRGWKAWQSLREVALVKKGEGTVLVPMMIEEGLLLSSFDSAIGG